jgi:membrane-bound lytic murein transglycosylase B
MMFHSIYFMSIKSKNRSSYFLQLSLFTIIYSFCGIMLMLMLNGCSSNPINAGNTNSIITQLTNLPAAQIPSVKEVTLTQATSNPSNSNINNIPQNITIPYAAIPEVQKNTINTNVPFFVQEFIKNNPSIKYPQEVAQALAQQQVNDEVIRLIKPAAQVLRRNWLVYRSRFIEPIRIKAGIQFWQTHRELLSRVEQEFGVDAAAIVGIIGVESIFGRYTGNFNVFNTLYTLAFYYPDTPNKKARETMFQKQLADYILWVQSMQPPYAPANYYASMGAYNHIGSFAGAMGMPQFMPESVRLYAVDYDKDGVINLTSSIPDIVASVANFLKQHGWRTNENVMLPVADTPENMALLKANATGKPQPNMHLKDLPSLNIDYAAYRVNGDTPFVVVDLPSGNDVVYTLGLYNFYVLTRYNQSFFYALSVHELGQAIKVGL